VSESNARAWRVAARIGCWIVGLEFALAVALIVYAGVHDFHEVFSGTPKAAAARIEASCSAPQGVTPCDVAVEEVDEGRYRLATNVDAAQLTVKVRLEAADRPHHLLVRTSQPSRLRLDMTPPAGESATPMDVTEPAGRVTAVLPPGAATVISLTPPADAKPSRIVIDELAVFDRPDGLLSENRAVFASIPPSRYHRTLVPRAIASICLFTIVEIGRAHV